MLWFLLVSRLRLGQPVLYHPIESHQLKLFHEGKVYSVEEEVIEKKYRFLTLPKWKNVLKTVWILMDSNLHRDEIPNWACQGGLLCTLIYTSSPTIRQWEKMVQIHFMPYLIYMNPYSTAEAQLLYVIEDRHLYRFLY